MSTVSYSRESCARERESASSFFVSVTQYLKGPRGPFIFLAFALLVSCRDAKVARPLQRPNVLLVTLDTTRADHLGTYGYAGASTPNLDRLAAGAVVFEHCISPSAFTLPSHSSIMTGLYPPAHGVRLNGDTALADQFETLAESFSRRGYRTGAFVGAFVLDSRWGIAQGFQHYDDEFHNSANQQLDLARLQRPANLVVDAALQWLNGASDKPFMTWVHLYDAHTPYEPPQPFRDRFATKGPHGLYDGEISFADSQVQRLLQWLDERGQRDNTIVIITADHGEGLGSHGESEHGFYVYDYAVRVPLIVKVPGTTPARVAAQVRTVDILPTLLDLTGEKIGDMDGKSLLPLLRDTTTAEPRSAYSESVVTKMQYGWAPLYSLRTNQHKFIEAPRSELYDLTKDPAEANNVLDQERRVALQLRKELQAIRDHAAKRAPANEEANLDAETVSKLASLGYLGGGSNTLTDGDDSALADPKDKMHLFESVAYAANLMLKEDYKEAANVLDIVLRDDPNIPQAQLLIVAAYRKTGRQQQAKNILDAYLKKDPGNVRALLVMAEMLSEEGKRDEVLAMCKRALASDSRNSRAHELMADVYMASNEHALALTSLRQAVAIQPKLSRSRINLAAALIATEQYAEADRVLSDVIREYPKFPLAHFHVALLRERERRFSEARAAYEKELANHPQSVVARFNLGNLLLRSGDVAGGAEQMRALIKQDPANARPYLLLAQALLDQPGRLGEAEALAMQGLERAKAPHLKALGYFLLADVYSRQGRRADLQRAVEMGKRFSERR